MGLPRKIDEAAKDGEEILAYRVGCGWFLAKWECAYIIMSDQECAESGMSEEELSEEYWFCGDSLGSFRRDDDDGPTHYIRLPPIPKRG